MLTRWGFTSVFDLGSIRENTMRIRDCIESGEVPGPRIRSTGDALLPPGIVPSEQILRVIGFMANPFPGVADASQAAAAAKGLLEKGVDGLKLHSLSDESVIRAAVAEGHRAGKPVFAHPGNGIEGLLAAVRRGVSLVAHTTPQSGPWDETVVATMKEGGLAIIPTLQIWRYLRRHDRISTQEQVVAMSTGQLRAWVAAGGTMLFGTDLGAGPDDPTEEYALLADAGLTFAQVVASLTTAPARGFGDGERLGRVAPASRPTSWYSVRTRRRTFGPSPTCGTPYAPASSSIGVARDVLD
jgi:Amidohydrolase family